MEMAGFKEREEGMEWMEWMDERKIWNDELGRVICLVGWLVDGWIDELVKYGVHMLISK